jgi:putative transposase
MRKSRFTDEQIVAILREADREPIGSVAKRHGISEQTIYTWRKRFGTFQADDVRRLKQLAAENARLKKLVAERDLEIEVMKEIAAKLCMVRPGVARSFVLLSEAACVNVSGLSRVNCCCSQAMMRCARIVPKKWYEQDRLVFLPGLTVRRSTVPTSALGPRNLPNVTLRRVPARPVRKGRAGA